MAGFKFTLLCVLAECLQASQSALLSLGLFTCSGWITTATSYGSGEARWGLTSKAPAIARPSINTCFPVLSETWETAKALQDPGPYFKNHLNGQWGTWPASFVSLQAQDACSLWFLAFTWVTFFSTCLYFNQTSLHLTAQSPGNGLTQTNLFFSLHQHGLWVRETKRGNVHPS